MPKRRNAKTTTQDRRAFRETSISRKLKPDRILTITLFGEVESAESIVRIVTRTIQNPRVRPGTAQDGAASNGASANGAIASRATVATRVKKDGARDVEQSRPASRKEGRWPLDLAGGGSGMLALRVWANAELESYGLFDNDLIVIHVGDPNAESQNDDELQNGDPAFAVIKNQVVIGWYRFRRGRIEIVPFIEGRDAVIASLSDVKVVFRLTAIACPGRTALTRIP